MFLHTPVLLTNVLEALSGHRIKRIFDGTVGLGGHLKAILHEHSDDMVREVVAVDLDNSAIEMAKEQLREYEDIIIYINDDFKNAAQSPDVPDQLDLVFLDLGVSSMQIDDASRGFSFLQPAPLDMRMGQGGITAETIVNTYSIKELERIFIEYGEIWWGGKLAKEIARRRKHKAIQMTTDLVDIILSVMPFGKWNRKIHPATLPFQALRIEVNAELLELDIAVERLCNKLSPQGMMCVIAFHSLEDAIIKKVFKRLSAVRSKSSTEEKSWALVTKKPIIASKDEIERNIRSRSAKLRIIKRET